MINSRKEGKNMVKEHKCFKTAKKTAKENNLFPVNYGTNILLDASILTDINLDSDCRDAIVENIQKYHIFHDRMAVFIVLYNKFITFEVRATFANHNVYDNKTGKKLYTIAQITNVKVTEIKYTSIWKDDQKVIEQIKKTSFHEPGIDIEI